MPVFDVDGGLVWQGFNPHIFGTKISSQEKPFYFGGSQVPTLVPKMSGGNIVTQQYRPVMSKVKKLPGMRKK